MKVFGCESVNLCKWEFVKVGICESVKWESWCVTCVLVGVKLYTNV